MDTLSLIHGDDFDNYLISKNQNSKIFVFDYSSFKKIKKYDFQYILADELLSITEREKIYQHVVSKLYWYEDQTLSDDQKQLFQFLDPLYLHQKLLVTLIQFSIIKKILEKEKPKKVFATKNLSKIISTINDKIPIVLLNDEKVEIFDKYDLRFKLFSKSISLKFSMSKLRKLQNFYESIMCSFNKIWLTNDNKLDDINIAGLEVKEIKKKYNFLRDQDFIPYMPLKNKDLKDLDLNILFLGWFLKWDPQEIYYYSTKKSGYILDDYKSDGSYGRYSSVDDKMEYLHFY